MFLDFVYRLIFLKKAQRFGNWNCFRLQVIAGVSRIIPDDGNRSSFRNVVLLRNIRRSIKSKNIFFTNVINQAIPRGSEVTSQDSSA
jgi:hypothetical protein